nr:ATP-grasp domain-containing protein [Halomonas olivaria]
MQLPPIEYAVNSGYHVITCDYLPDNPGHEIAHEYFNISTTDKEGVLKLAERKKINGIVAYASDPAAPTAAYVAEKLNLPGNPYESVNILARKDLFRSFLIENGFNTPKNSVFRKLEDAIEWCSEVKFPLIMKPVDSSGSKGVSLLKNKAELRSLFNDALSYSFSGKVIIEEYIEKSGYQIDSDVFLLDGELIFWYWGDQHQDKECNPHAPIGISFPTMLSKNHQVLAASEIERLLKLLNMKTGAFNVEFFFDSTGKIWIIEIGPRNGGNLIPEVIRESTGIDLIKMTVDAAVSNKTAIQKFSNPTICCASYILHAKKDGILEEIKISEKIKKKTIKYNQYKKIGDMVKKYKNSQDSIGSMIIKFSNIDEMSQIMTNAEDFIDVKVS